MNPDQLDIARRLAADSRFNKWTGGLRIVYGDEPHEQFRVDGDGEDAVIISAEGDVWSQQDPEAIPWQLTLGVPDLTDAATGGVLLDMVRALFVEVEMSMNKDGFGLNCWRSFGRLVGFTGTTLAEACARALLAEWGGVRDEAKHEAG